MSGAEFSLTAASIAGAVAFAREAGTGQLAMVQGDQVVVDEVYEDEAVDVYAVQKGLVSVLFAIAAHRGLLRLDDPVSHHLGPGWTHLPPQAELRLTIRTVLNMTTGMDDELRPSGEVGVTWRYDNVTYNYLKTALEVATGLSLAEVSDAWLFGPLGMGSTRWVERSVLRPDGQAITALESTAVDLARFGSMVLQGGGDVAPRPYVASLGRPGSLENPAWGLCWWSNEAAHHRLPRRESELQDGPVVPGAPADTITARGAAENRLFVVPSLDLVVARTVKPVSGERPEPFDRPFWTLLNHR
ncbi:MAG: serine hydrolase [Actinomycetota bacterium]